MKKIVSLALFFMITLQFVFADTSWCDESKLYLIDKGYYQIAFDIAEDNSRSITREEFFTLIASTCGIREDNIVPSFSDYELIKLDFRPYINALANRGIMNGKLIAEKCFVSPTETITRQEACVILGNISGLNFYSETKFSDESKVAGWAINSVAAITSTGLINGYPDGEFKPANMLTIAEATKIIADADKNGYLEKNKLEVLAGTGNLALADGELFFASFYGPMGLTERLGKVYVADSKNNSIRVISDEKVETVAGSVGTRDLYNVSIGSFKDGADALFNNPTFLATSKKGILISDSGNNLIRHLQGTKVTTYAGNIEGGYLDGKRTKALFNNPTGIAVDSRGVTYISDTNNNVIRKIDRNDNVTTFAGLQGNGGYLDGAKMEALFNKPMGLAIVDDVLYVADCGNQRIRKIEDGTVSTVAGNGTETYEGTNEIVGDFIDGDKKIACFNFPQNVLVDGNIIYVADVGNSAIRKIDEKGNVTTIVGLKKMIYEKDAINLGSPFGLLLKDARIYITDTLNNVILMF